MSIDWTESGGRIVRVIVSLPGRVPNTAGSVRFTAPSRFRIRSKAADRRCPPMRANRTEGQ
jgi:hypothetical protein